MSAWMKLTVGVAACGVILVAVLRQPLAVRAEAMAYDRAQEDDPALRLALAARGEKAVPALLQLALSSDCHSRRRLVTLLRTLAPEETYRVFAAALKGFHVEQQIAAAEALGWLGQADARPALEWASRSDDARLQDAARSALAQLGRETP